MSSFNITTPETSVNLRPSSVKRGETAKGTATYSLTNRTGATVRAGLRIKPGDGAEQSWFTVRDGDERDIAPGATESLSIDLAVPGGAANHSFHVVVVNLADPDNDYESGSAIAFDAPAVEANGGGVKWWMIAGPIALVLVVGGAIAWFLINGDEPARVTLADFRGSPLEKAQQALAEQGVTMVERALSPGAPEFDRQRFYDRIIVEQTPESDGSLEIPQSTPVELGWAWTPMKVTVPTNLVNSAFGPAVAAVEGAGLRYSGHTGPPGNQPSDRHYAAVASASPTGEQEAGTGITFTMKWQESRRFEDVVIWQREFELNRDRLSPAVEFRVPPQ